MASLTLQTEDQSWSLASFFPSFDGPEHRAAHAALVQGLTDLGAEVARAAALSGATLASWGEIFLRYERLSAVAGHERTFLYCLSSEDTENDAVRAHWAGFALVEALLAKLRTALAAALARATEAEMAQFEQDPQLASARYIWRRWREEGTRAMATEQEALATDLGVDGFSAWGRLYETLAGRMTFTMTFPDGTEQTVPMAQRRLLTTHDDRRIRAAAFTQGQVPWITHQDTLAAALNGITGVRQTLNARRGREHFLDAPLHEGGMTRATLDALMGALETHVEVARRTVRLMARQQGTPGVALYDTTASHWPLPDRPPLSWAEGCSLVHRAFQKSYPALAEYFAAMLKDRWIESAVRPGKAPGAYAIDSPLIDEERIFMTDSGTLQEVITLAHEVGHTWHSRHLRGERPLLRPYPMTLAETASNVAERLFIRFLREDPKLTAAERLHFLGLEVTQGVGYLLNIPSRFSFECAFYDERARGEVSATRLGDLVVAAQRRFFGDTLLPDGTDPFFWASKPHFFMTDTAFYNYPYSFGYLLSYIIDQRFQTEGPAFIPQFENFLRLSGQLSCEDCVRETLGGDTTSPDFWVQGIAKYGESVTALELEMA
jgi:oligoendopeptidase F